MDAPQPGELLRLPSELAALLPGGCAFNPVVGAQRVLLHADVARTFLEAGSALIRLVHGLVAGRRARARDEGRVAARVPEPCDSPVRLRHGRVRRSARQSSLVAVRERVALRARLREVHLADAEGDRLVAGKTGLAEPLRRKIALERREVAVLEQLRLQIGPHDGVRSLVVAPRGDPHELSRIERRVEHHRHQQHRTALLREKEERE